MSRKSAFSCALHRWLMVRGALLSSSLAAAGALSLVAGCSGEAPRGRPDVLLITIDTLRADFVHCYGFPHPTTPNLDALAARGVLFERAVAASTATAPAHASIMSSRWVREHSIGAENGPTRLEGVPTLAEAFRDAGYETAAFVSNVVLKARSGLDAGFDHYDDALPAAESNRAMYLERVASETVERAKAWLAAPRQAPFFLWVHLQDPHGPYTPGAPWSERVPELSLRTDRELPVLGVNRGRGGIPHYQALPGVRRGSRYAGLYAGEVALTDDRVGALLEDAEVAAGADGLLVALTADHGESLDEDGFFFQHGHTTTPEQALVPLLIAGPGVAAARVGGVASHVDIAPTLLELAGLPPLDDAGGLSLVAALREGGALPERSVFTDVGHELSAYDPSGHYTVKVLAGSLDWQRYEQEGTRLRKVDAAELPVEIARYAASAVPTVAAAAMEPEDLERLRALGYLPPREAPRSERGAEDEAEDERGEP